MQLSSAAFENGGMIPDKYTCHGLNINPPLNIQNIPKDAKCLVLITDDPDAPGGAFVHWVVYNIPVINMVPENSVPGIPGMNDYGKKLYGGPCPPSGIHRYYFKCFALSTRLSLEDGVAKQTIIEAMQGHVLESTELMGRYQNK